MPFCATEDPTVVSWLVRLIEKFTLEGGVGGLELEEEFADFEQPIPIQDKQAIATGAVTFSKNCLLSTVLFL